MEQKWLNLAEKKMGFGCVRLSLQLQSIILLLPAVPGWSVCVCGQSSQAPGEGNRVSPQDPCMDVFSHPRRIGTVCFLGNAGLVP